MNTPLLHVSFTEKTLCSNGFISTDSIKAFTFPDAAIYSLYHASGQLCFHLKPHQAFYHVAFQVLEFLQVN